MKTASHDRGFVVTGRYDNPRRHQWLQSCRHDNFRVSVSTGFERARQIVLPWHHNERGGVSNHRHLDCLLNRLFRRWSKKTSKLRVTGLCEGNSPVTVNSPHKGPVTWQMFPLDDVMMANNGQLAQVMAWWLTAPSNYLNLVAYHQWGSVAFHRKR